MNQTFETVQLDYFFHSWFREEETVMRLAKTARGFGDPLAGTFFAVLFFIPYLLLLFFPFSYVRKNVPFEVGCAVGHSR
jgi:hypothetical protein